MRSVMRTGLVLFLALLCASGAFAQKKTKASLQKEINTLQQQIATANQLLKETSKNKEATLNQVTLIEQNIQSRQELVNACNEQISLLDDQIRQGEKNIDNLNVELKKLRGEYAKMIQFANKNRSHYDRLEFLFASEDFNQALRRLRYIQQFADARKTKMEQIACTQKKVGDEVEANKKAKEEQAALLAEEQAQQEALKKEKAELNTKVTELKKQEKSIQQSIKEKQEQSKKFQKQIDDIIAEEIRLANERAAKESAKNTKTNKSKKSNNMALTPAEQKLSNSFSSNKGKLPWPVERGVISSSFGKHTSSVSDKVVITNNGVDIMTTENAKARSVFDGEVSKVVKPAASNMAVIIRHGDYFTVYSQLDEVYVSPGDKVKTKQEIGRVHTDRTEGKTEIHFELRCGKETQNPSQWLAK